MNSSKSNNGGVEFFGAVSKNCKTVIVERSKGAVKSKIAQRGVAKHNMAMFKCHPDNNNTVRKELLNRPRFKLTHQHHTALMDASLNFLQNRIEIQ